MVRSSLLIIFSFLAISFALVASKQNGAPSLRPRISQRHSKVTHQCQEKPSSPKPSQPEKHPNARAIYFISNAAKNEVVALKVGHDGTLSDGSITATGGCGSVGVDAAGLPALPDGLFSQGSVKVSGNSLLAVNAGSNTLSMFTIDPTDPTRLTLLGKPVDTLGEFPLSVAASEALQIACVANSGSRSGIACFSMNSSTGLTPLDTALRPVDLGQTTPPVGPTNTISHVFFNADSTALLTTVKGDPTTNKTGFISVFPVIDGSVSLNETRSSPAGTAVLFGTALIPNSKDILLTASTPIPAQAATCWATVSELTGTGFVTDVAVNHLVEVDTKTGEIVSTLNSTNGNPGMIDLVAAGNFIYALSPGNNATRAAVAVFDVSGGRGAVKEIQNFHPAGVTITAQGMAFTI